MPKFKPKNSTEEDGQENEEVFEVKRNSKAGKETGIDTSNRKSTEALPEATTSQFAIEELPSQFKAYPDVRIFANSYSYREVKLLSDSRIPLDKQYEIMLGGLTVEGMDSRDLTLFDFIYIGVLRKLASLGAQKYRVPYFCGHCRKTGAHEFDFTDVGFDTLEVPELPIKIKFYTLGQHIFSPLTVGDYMELFRLDKLYERDSSGNEITRNDGVSVIDPVAILAMLCIDLSFEEAYKLFYDVKNHDDQHLLEDVDDLLNHGIQPLTFNCAMPMEEVEAGTHPSEVEKCGGRISLGLLGGESTIVPFREHGEADETRISFGSKGTD